MLQNHVINLSCRHKFEFYETMSKSEVGNFALAQLLSTFVSEFIAEKINIPKMFKHDHAFQLMGSWVLIASI